MRRACPTDSPGSAGSPRHASADPPACVSPQAERARYALGLLLEDPAAAVHNHAFARTLLDDAERRLDF